MTNQGKAGLKPADYMSADPAQQGVGDTQGGMESLGSYEDGGDEEDLMQSGSKSGLIRAGRALDGTRAERNEAGTGSPMTDSLSNNGNSV